METKVPGIVAHHAIITPDCRKVRRSQFSAEVDAFDEAVRRVRDEYLLVIHHRAPDDGFNAHLVLTIEEASTEGVERTQISPTEDSNESNTGPEGVESEGPWHASDNVRDGTSFCTCGEAPNERCPIHAVDTSGDMEPKP